MVAGFQWLLSEGACALCYHISDQVKQMPLGENFAVIGHNEHYKNIRTPPLHPGCRCSQLAILKPEYGGPENPEWGKTAVQPKVEDDGQAKEENQPGPQHQKVQKPWPDSEEPVSATSASGETTSAGIPQFKNNAEAAEWIKENLKTPFAELPDDVEMESIVLTAEAVRELEATMGRGIPGTIQFGGVAYDAYASFNPATRTLHFEKTGAGKVEERRKKSNARWKAETVTDQPYFSTTSYKGLVYHEACHAFDHESGYKLSKPIQDWPLKIQNMVVEISGYAEYDFYKPKDGHSGTEAAAECFSAYLTKSERASHVPKRMVKLIQSLMVK